MKGFFYNKIKINVFKRVYLHLIDFNLYIYFVF
jgi:hypothetical protein